MDLTEVRNDINILDRKMKALFDERLTCSNRVAEVKMANNDDVFKPLREKEMCDDHLDNKEYLAFIKKIVAISRKYQYKIFEQNKLMEDFKNNSSNSEVFLKGGILELKLKVDGTSTNGLNVNDIISIIGDTSLEIAELNFSKDAFIAKLNVKDINEDKYEALILAYMLDKETIH